MDLLGTFSLVCAMLLLSVIIIIAIDATNATKEHKLKKKMYEGLKQQSIEIYLLHNDHITDISDLYKRLRDNLNLRSSSTYNKLVTSSVCFLSGTRTCDVIYEKERFIDNVTPQEFLNQVIPSITKAYIDEKYTYVIFVGKEFIFELLHIQLSQHKEYIYLLKNGYLDKAVKISFLKMNLFKYRSLSEGYRMMTHLESCDEEDLVKVK